MRRHAEHKEELKKVESTLDLSQLFTDEEDKTEEKKVRRLGCGDGWWWW